MHKFCQSCGMPLEDKGSDNRGTNVDGSLSDKYCHLCYKDGQFLNPHLTYEEMLDIGKKGIDSGTGSVISKFFMKLLYPMQLKNLERWKNK